MIMELASPLSQETEEISSAPSDEEDNSNAQLQSAFHLPLAANILLVQKKRQKAGRRMKKPKCVKQTKTLFHFNLRPRIQQKPYRIQGNPPYVTRPARHILLKKENVRQVLIQIGKTCALYLSVEIGTSNKATVVVPTIHEVTDAWKAK